MWALDERQNVNAKAFVEREALAKPDGVGAFDPVHRDAQALRSNGPRDYASIGGCVKCFVDRVVKVFWIQVKALADVDSREVTIEEVDDSLQKGDMLRGMLAGHLETQLMESFFSAEVNHLAGVKHHADGR